MRRLISIVLGYLVFGASAAVLFAVTKEDPHVPASIRFMALSTLYGVAFAALGGFIAVALSREPSSPA